MGRNKALLSTLNNSFNKNVVYEWHCISLCNTKISSVSLGFMVVEGGGGGSEERTEAKRNMGFPLSSGLDMELE